MFKVIDVLDDAVIVIDPAITLGGESISHIKVKGLVPEFNFQYLDKEAAIKFAPILLKKRLTFLLLSKETTQKLIVIKHHAGTLPKPLIIKEIDQPCIEAFVYLNDVDIVKYFPDFKNS